MATITHQKKLYIHYFVLIASAVIMPDVVFGILVRLAHIFLEGAHLLFELFESWLDHAVEHHFHTGTRETQLIVFYLMMAMAAVGVYCLWWKTKKLFRSAKNSLQAVSLDYKNRFISYWEVSAHNKFMLIAGTNVVLTVLYLVGF